MIGSDMRLMIAFAMATSAADIFSKSMRWISSRSDHVSDGVDLDLLILLLSRTFSRLRPVGLERVGQPARHLRPFLLHSARQRRQQQGHHPLQDIGLRQKTWNAWSNSSRWSRRFTNTAWSVQ